MPKKIVKNYVPSLNEVLSKVLKKADNWNARNKLNVATATKRINLPSTTIIKPEALVVLREWYRDRAARKEREKAEEIEWGIQRAYGQRIQEAYERGVSDGYEQHINDAYERGLDKGIDIGIEKGRKLEREQQAERRDRKGENEN